MPYDPRMVQPMRDELTRIGVTELMSAAEVDAFMAATTGTALLMVNSVCGCAAGSARPGLALALQHPERPERVATVFAGQDLEATARARSYFPAYEPSSPAFVLFREGKPVGYVSRRMIEGQQPAAVEGILAQAFATVLSAAAG
ncbi:MAG TPA: BrxA/BrxB family bacilliredoxin [Candidatus Udaeobacter sp.]|nr:BrxA/BrxB family bacilliredoxin [Candidatus Udaeobacter sp.]